MIDLENLGEQSPIAQTNDKTKVLVVEDDKDMTTMIKMVLEVDYNLFFADSGQDALAFIEQESPELILLDVGLPDISGLSVCQTIKDGEQKNNVAIMCVSGYNDTKDILKAYKVGADDYITKPFDSHLLKAKVNSLAQFQKQKSLLRQDGKMTEQVAFQSMLEASNYGEVIQFFKNTISTENIQELSQTFFSLMSALDLSACIEIRCKSVLSVRSDGADCSPIEKQLFESLKNTGRIYTFNDRTVVNDQHVSILIKNMPKAETIRGRIADLLCVINELVEEKVKDILRRDKLSVAQQRVLAISGNLSGQMSDLERGTTNQLSMVEKLERGFDFMDLTQEQERFFQSLFEQSRTDLEKLNRYLTGLDTQLNELSTVLQS